MALREECVVRVELTRKLGQNKPGAVIDTTVSQASWLMQHRFAVAAVGDPGGGGGAARSAEEPARSGVRARRGAAKRDTDGAE